MSERERLVALEGALNWRDLGGYPTADGHVTRWDRVFRAGGVIEATPSVTNQDTVGVFDPGSATWSLRNENSPGAPDAGSFVYGGPGWRPVVGDWNGDGVTTMDFVFVEDVARELGARAAPTTKN